MNVIISKHLGVLQGLLFEDLRIILTGDVHPPGQKSEMVEFYHGGHKHSPEI